MVETLFPWKQLIKEIQKLNKLILNSKEVYMLLVAK